MKGFVYVISNPSLPGLVKIGYSMKDPHLRAGNDFDPAGLPDDYVVEYHALVDDPREVEQQVHARLKDQRHKKEWFKVSAQIAVVNIESVAKIIHWKDAKFYCSEKSDPTPDAQAKKTSTTDLQLVGLSGYLPNTAYHYLHKANIRNIHNLINTSEAEIAKAMSERKTFLPGVLELRQDFIKSLRKR